MRRWLIDNGILVPGDACGPDVKAGDLALRLAAARLLGDHIGGLALDWSKCYDRLPLHLLQQVAEAAGQPRAVGVLAGGGGGMPEPRGGGRVGARQGPR